MDKHSDDEILEWFSDSAVRRMQSYETYVGHLETGALEGFLGPWNINTKYTDSCRWDNCEWFICNCIGENYCRVTSSFLEDVDLGNGCGSCSATMSSEECEDTRLDYISSEVEGKRSINKILDEMKTSLKSAIEIFGKFVVA